MHKVLLTLAAFVLSITTFSQSRKNQDKEKDEDIVFYPFNWTGYRDQLSVPPYGLDKVQKLIEKASNGNGFNIVLPPDVYATLGVREKFTYHMIHGESYSQNCNMSNFSLHDANKLFAHLPDALGQYHMSRRQKDFFRDNRDTAMALMLECIASDRRIGLNFKQVIVDINADEMIPVMIDIYNIDRKDHDMLTVLMLLMVNGRYAPFLASTEYMTLYGSKDSRWKGSIDLKNASEESIIRQATDFYHGIIKKS